MGADVEQVVEDARDFVEQYANVLAAKRHFEAEHLFQGQAIRMFVGHHRHIVETIHIRHGLNPGASLGQLFGGAVEQTDIAPAKPGALPAAISSIATGLVLENIVRLGFGNDMRGYDRPIARDVHFGNIRVNPQQTETMGIAIAIMQAPPSSASDETQTFDPRLTEKAFRRHWTACCYFCRV